MQVVIRFCALCEYRTYANRVVAELEQHLGKKIQCSIERTGDLKVFKVIAEGQTIYDKGLTGRFPNPFEVLRAVKPILAAHEASQQPPEQPTG